MFGAKTTASILLISLMSTCTPSTIISTTTLPNNETNANNAQQKGSNGDTKLARHRPPLDPDEQVEREKCMDRFTMSFCERYFLPADRTYYIAATEILWEYAPFGDIINIPVPEQHEDGMNMNKHGGDAANHRAHSGNSTARRLAAANIPTRNRIRNRNRHRSHANPRVIQERLRNFYRQKDANEKENENVIRRGRRLLNDHGGHMGGGMDGNGGADAGGHGVAHTAGAYLTSSPTRIGSKYWKAVYQEYTDVNFDVKKGRAPEWRHLGMLGPVIRGFVGETIKIVFKNMASFPTSMHPHGVQYGKPSEGAVYNDTSLDGDAIQSGDYYVYFWRMITDSVDDWTSSKVWMYHSHVDEIADTNSGLVGPIIVSKRPNHGRFRPKDVDREWILFLTKFEEMQSMVWDKNVQYFLNSTGNLTDDALDALMDDASFVESNSMYAFNGYVYGNLDATKLSAQRGDRVRWYLMSLGNQLDGPHVQHWHGNIISHNRETKDSLMILSGASATVDMNTDAVGDWMFHCHVNHHIHGGMIGMYRVIESVGQE